MRSAKCIHKEMQVHVEGRAVKPNDHSLVADKKTSKGTTKCSLGC
jgi:hypothetical protein